MVCIYHSRDLDGFASGAIVKKRFPDAKLIGFDYGQKLPMADIPQGEPIVMIDVSLPMPEMIALAKHSTKMTWIDHHRSAIKEYEESEKTAFLIAILRDGIAACEIGWSHFFAAEAMPIGISLLGRYDTWRNHDVGEWNKIIMPFQYGMRQVCNSAESFPIDRIGDQSYINAIIHNGDIVLDYQSSQNALLCRRAAFESDFMGYKAICLNMGGASSQSFHSVYDETKHDLMIPFFFNGKKWIFSLYTTKENIDCSLIAKQNGGGGHKKAAGFESDDFIFFTKAKS